MDTESDIPIPRSKSVEISAGAVLVQRVEAEAQALLIRVRKEGYEIPKGHVESGESHAESALRELREETSVLSSLSFGPEIGSVEYSFEHDGVSVRKIVHYFVAFIQCAESAQFGARPKRTRDLRWITFTELATLPLVNEELRPIIARALLTSPMRGEFQ